MYASEMDITKSICYILQSNLTYLETPRIWSLKCNRKYILSPEIARLKIIEVNYQISQLLTTQFTHLKNITSAARTKLQWTNGK